MKHEQGRCRFFNRLTTAARSPLESLTASSLASLLALSLLLAPALLLFPGDELLATSSPASAGSGVPSNAAADSQMTKFLCSTLKRLNARRGTPPAEMQMDLIMSVGKAVEFDRVKVAQVRKDIDRLTTTGCPVDRELTLSILKVKSLEQAMK